MVPHWQMPYLGIRTLPRLTAWEIDAFFTLDPTERDYICGYFRGLNRLAVALQLGILRMTGCPLDGSAFFPPSCCPNRRKRTRYDHQQWAMARLDFASLTPGRRLVLVPVRTTGAHDR